MAREIEQLRWVRASPAQRLCAAGPRRCPTAQLTTLEAPISIRESRPKPASATERAAMASTTMPTTFQASVHSKANPRRGRRAVPADAAAEVLAMADMLPGRSGTAEILGVVRQIPEFYQ